MGAAITEVKRHLDGRVERFACEALAVSPARAVVRFVSPGAIGPYPPGTVTVGFFWPDRPYNLYRLEAPDGTLLGHRFDVVTDVRIAPDRIEYVDLILDVVVDPDGTVRVEDEEELRAAAARGLLSPEGAAVVERARGELLAGYRRLIEDAVAEVGSGSGGGARRPEGSS